MISKRQIFKSGLIGLLTLTLLNFPFLSMANRTTLLWSIPVQYLFIFGFWILAIVLLYATMRRPGKRNKNQVHE